MEKEEAIANLGSLLEEIVARMGFRAEISVEAQEQDGRQAYLCDMRTDESNFLIGQHGMNLQALQHVSRVLFRRKFNESLDFVLDINSYRREKNDSIVKLAKGLAEEAVSENRAIVMRPMSPYERRVVHLELSSDERISTESIGEGEDRRIVIKPIGLE